MKSNNQKYEFHSVANIFPMCNEKESEALRNDIKKNGLHEPIHIFDGKIIDGRNRYLACLAVDVKPRFQEYKESETELLNYVISLNLHRRHLNSSQKACLAVDVMPEIEKNTKTHLSEKMSAIRQGNKEKSNNMSAVNSREIASKIFSVSGGYISSAKQIKDYSIELFNKIKNGKLTLQKAKLELSNYQIITNKNTVSADYSNKELQNNNGVLSKLTNPKSSETSVNVDVISFSKNELKKINDLISVFSVSEQKAKEYILLQKPKKKIVSTSNNQRVGREKMSDVKFKIEPEAKLKLILLAKTENKSISEILRDLLNDKIK